ncbi:hypothetical protein MMC19_005103 [Ptychographa xylographoides]|nr:hypothetical protein [Ptychographa xylographoides]
MTRERAETPAECVTFKLHFQYGIHEGQLVLADLKCTISLTPTMSSEIHAAIPKSILKKFPLTKPSAQTPPSPPLEPTPREARNRVVALQHAQVIQQRKDIESSIFAATETLLDYPSSPTVDPEHPSTADAARVKGLLRQFRPSDYDSLVEERNIEGKCGYVLCPRPHRLEETEAKHRIIWAGNRGTGDMKVVKKKELEKWCSEDCGKRALYLRVQLNEVAAWERPGTGIGSIELYGEARTTPKTTTTSDKALEALTDSLKQLAVERGGTYNEKIPNAVEVTIREKDVSESNQERSFQEDDYCEASRIYGSVEGYVPNISGSRARRRHWEDELHDTDMLDTI